MFVLAEQRQRLQDAAIGERGASAAAADPYGGRAPSTQYEMWVPAELSDALTTLLTRDLASALDADVQVQVSRNDWASYGDDPFLMTKLVVTGIAVLVLLPSDSSTSLERSG